jgi:hypothetical protein
VEFTIDVENPDRLHVSILWFVGGVPSLDGEDLRRVLLFDSTSVVNVSASLVSDIGIDSVNWEVQVLNSRPEVVSWSPTDMNVRLKEPATIDFTVEVTDEDDDELLYSWGSTNASLPRCNGNRCGIEFEDGGFYEVSVVISDGDEVVGLTWTVEVAEDDPSMTEPPFDIISWVVLLLLLSAAIASYSVLRRRTGGSESKGGKG